MHRIPRLRPEGLSLKLRAVLPLLVVLLLAGGSSVFPGIPAPPEGVYEAELTKAANARAQVEIKGALAQLERDTSIPPAQKKEIRRKIERLRVAVYTTPKTLDETVAFYERQIPSANFLFGDRNLLDDAADIARSGGFELPAPITAEWGGKRGRSARWSQTDGSAEIDVEDHLIDPRDATIRKRTVVLLSSTQ